MKEENPPQHHKLPSSAYILGALVFSRLCFWGLAHLQGYDFVGGMCRWDCDWYAELATQGYDLKPHGNDFGDAANWAFFPFYPLCMALLHQLLPISMKFTGIIVSNVAFFFAIRLSLNYLVKTRQKVSCELWVWLCVIGPYSFYFSTVYSEALFWLCGCGALLAWERKKYIQTGLITACLCATRLFGIFWLLAYLVDLWRQRKDVQSMDHAQRSSLVLGLCLSPLGLALFLSYLYFHMGDALAFSHIQIAWDRSIAGALSQWGTSVRDWSDFEFLLAESPKSRYAHAYFNFFALVSIFLVAYLIRQKRLVESIIGVCSLIIAILVGAMSLPRFIVGTPVFAFAFHDLVVRYLPKKLHAAFLGLLFLFNLWLLSNWYELAFFLV